MPDYVIGTQLSHYSQGICQFFMKSQQSMRESLLSKSDVTYEVAFRENIRMSFFT
jgi:hypothetical protein